MDNNTTNPENFQGLSPDQMTAALGFSNTVMQQMMIQQAQEEQMMNPEAPESLETAPETPETSLRDKYPKEEETNDLGQIKEEIQSLKEEIKKVLDEVDNEDENGQED